MSISVISNTPQIIPSETKPAARPAAATPDSKIIMPPDRAEVKHGLRMLGSSAAGTLAGAVLPAAGMLALKVGGEWAPVVAMLAGGLGAGIGLINGAGVGKLVEGKASGTLAGAAIGAGLGAAVTGLVYKNLPAAAMGAAIGAIAGASSGFLSAAIQQK